MSLPSTYLKVESKPHPPFLNVGLNKILESLDPKADTSYTPSIQHYSKAESPYLNREHSKNEPYISSKIITPHL